jgi:hypothetical protein
MKKATALGILLSASLFSFYIVSAQTQQVVTTNAVTASGTCLNLSKTLATGSKDSLTGGEVTKVQKFLYGTHLTVEATGYFGAMTKNAVNSFQTTYKEDILKQSDGTYIQPTGSTGPKTRAKINDLSCSGAVIASPQKSEVQMAEQKVVVEQPVVAYANNQVSGALSVSSPWNGQMLENDSEKISIVTITWNPNEASTANIELADINGSRVKYVAQNTANSGSYVWRYDPTLESGRYRIIVRAGSVSAQSGNFTLGVVNNPTTPTTPVTSCPTGQTLVNGICQTTQPTVANTTPCPAVSSTPRTYTYNDYKTFTGGSMNPGYMDASGNESPSVPYRGFVANDGSKAAYIPHENQVQLSHYRYPETTEVGTFIYYGERCALSATPNSRTCPYTNSIYGNGPELNSYSIFIHAPDPSNDLNEVGDRVYTAYKKPIVGFSRYNRAFDVSLPFTISASEVGKKFDFQYSAENQNLANEGQYSISECEGDFSERSVVVGNYKQLVRASLIATSGLEGSKFTPGLSTPWLALKTNKVYYLNLRWIKQKSASSYAGALCIPDANNNCLSPFVPTGQIPNSSIHEHALGRQFRNAGEADAAEFYRWHISQESGAFFGRAIPSLGNAASLETELRNDPLFDQPGGVVLSPGLYYPACNALGTVTGGIRGSDCQVKCMSGYTLHTSGGYCVRQ